MDAVATGAIGRAGGPVLGGQTVVTFKKCFDPVGRQIVLGVQLFRSVAFAANLFGYGQGRAVLESDNLVFGMAVTASGGVAAALRHGLPMHARHDILGFLFMALSTGFGQVREIERRGWRGGAQDAM